MTAYCARVRFRLGARVRIETDALDLSLADGEQQVVLESSPSGQSIREAKQLVCLVRPFASAREAQEAGMRWRATLEKAFARMNIAADFGDRAATGGATAYGLAALERQYGARVLNDVHGVMVFDCEPWPRFVRSEASGVVGKPAERLLRVVSAAVHRGYAMSERESLAYDLYSASFSVDSADARFALLMMALETIIDPQPRYLAVVSHVDQMIAITEAADLPPSERASIAGSLSWLRSESIGQAGRRIAAQLGDRTYMGYRPVKFFTMSYELRSRLVHGAYPRPTRHEVDAHAAHLELFVRDLLSVELLEDFPES